MTLSSGIDIVSITRVRDICIRRPAFSDRVLTESEKEYCQAKAFPYKSIAARFAAKEAFYKAAYPLGGRFYFRDIEIIFRNGYPEISPASPAGIFIKEGGYECSISITHEEDSAAAVAVISRN